MTAQTDSQAIRFLPQTICFAPTFTAPERPASTSPLMAPATESGTAPTFPFRARETPPELLYASGNPSKPAAAAGHRTMHGRSLEIYRTLVSLGEQQPIADMPELTLALRGISNLRSWPQGWDDAGAEAPHGAAVTRAHNLLAAFGRQLRGTGARFVAPNVTASADGEIVFEWWHESRKLTLYVGTNEADVGYVKVWGRDVETEMDSGDLTKAGKLMSLWSWLISDR